DLLETVERFAHALQRDVGCEQIVPRLDRDQIAERIIEAAALADGRADETDLHPVAQARLLHCENAGDIANRVQLDHRVLRSVGLGSPADLYGVWRCASTLRLR